MGTEDSALNHYRRLENMYHGAGINRFFAPRLAIDRGTATLKIPIREDFFHAAGAAHGTVYFKAADDAAFFAANSLVRGYFVLTSTFHLSLLRPIKEGTLRAEGRVIQKATHLILAESFLYDDRDREIGRGTGSFAISKIALTEEIGYR